MTSPTSPAFPLDPLRDNCLKSATMIGPLSDEALREALNYFTATPSTPALACRYGIWLYAEINRLKKALAELNKDTK